jgi:hypothetical protein
MWGGKGALKRPLYPAREQESVEQAADCLPRLVLDDESDGGGLIDEYQHGNRRPDRHLATGRWGLAWTLGRLECSGGPFELIFAHVNEVAERASSVAHPR